MIGSDTEPFSESFDLLTKRENNQQRVRYYHFFEKKGRNEWTDEMTRYRIEDGQLFLEGKIKLKNNPPWKPDT